MIITGIVMLFIALLEYVLILIYADYRMLTRLVELGSSTGTVVSNIPEPFWDVYKVQIILSLTLIVMGIVERYRSKDKRKDEVYNKVK